MQGTSWLQCLPSPDRRVKASLCPAWLPANKKKRKGMFSLTLARETGERCLTNVWENLNGHMLSENFQFCPFSNVLRAVVLSPNKVSQICPHFSGNVFPFSIPPAVSTPGPRLARRSPKKCKIPTPNCHTLEPILAPGSPMSLPSAWLSSWCSAALSSELLPSPLSLFPQGSLTLQWDH